MKFLVKKCLFTALIMTASVSLPMFNRQQGQADPVASALNGVVNFYNRTTLLYDAAQTLCDVVKPVLGFAVDPLENRSHNLWLKHANETSYRYAWRLLNTITQLYGSSILATEQVADFTKYAKRVYDNEPLPDIGGQKSRYPEAWADKVVVRAEKLELQKDLNELKACKIASEKKKKYFNVMKKWAVDKVISSNDPDKVVRHTAYQQEIVTVALSIGIGNKARQE